MLTQSELGWLAGIFEGEGSARIYRATPKSGKCGDYKSACYYAQIFIVSNTDLAVLKRAEYLLLKAGLNPYININGPTGLSKKLCGIVRVSGYAQQATFLRLVLPLLNGYKLQQANLCLRFFEVREARGWKPGTKGVRGSLPKPIEWSNEDDALYMQQTKPAIVM
jgi:hypothetical protein